MSQSQCSRLARWSVPLCDLGPVREEDVRDVRGEFPRIDERYAGRRHASAYCALRVNSARADFQAVAHVHGSDFQVDHFSFGEEASVSEPVFVSRRSSAPRDAGWLLALAWRPDWTASRLAVFKAGHVPDGPVAMIHLPQRVPDGFHGSFVSDVFLASNSAA